MSQQTTPLKARLLMSLMNEHHLALSLTIDKLSGEDLKSFSEQLPNFSLEEFQCSHTGENRMVIPFLRILQTMRTAAGFPFRITSGYRSPEHPIEKAKDKPGFHALGLAADIAISNAAERFKVVDLALQNGLNGIGIASNFVHVDMRPTTSVIWTYP